VSTTTPESESRVDGGEGVGDGDDALARRAAAEAVVSIVARPSEWRRRRCIAFDGDRASFFVGDRASNCRRGFAKVV
jgi:hypothetical protein